MTVTIEAQIRDYLNEYLIFDDTVTYRDDESFLERNLIDSTSVVELVLFVEDSFGFSVPDSEITPGNFDSVRQIAEYVRAKTAAEPS
jgi:acyl carrier protein